MNSDDELSGCNNQTGGGGWWLGRWWWRCGRGSQSPMVGEIAGLVVAIEDKWQGIKGFKDAVSR